MFKTVNTFFPVLSNEEILRFCLIYCILIINFFSGRMMRSTTYSGSLVREKIRKSFSFYLQFEIRKDYVLVALL
jgi:hypothetical protein